VSGWKPVERGIRKDNPAVYALLETKMSLLRIALQAEPRREESARTGSLRRCMQLLADYSQGKSIAIRRTPPAEDTSIEGLISLPEAKLPASAAAGDSRQSSRDHGTVHHRLGPWPKARCRLLRPAVYTSIENESAAVTGYLLSNPPKLEQAMATIMRQYACRAHAAGR
jgi:high-affinity iron transporter